VSPNFLQYQALLAGVQLSDAFLRSIKRMTFADDDDDDDDEEVKTSHNLVLYVFPCLALTIHIWCRLHCATIAVVWGFMTLNRKPL